MVLQKILRLGEGRKLRELERIVTEVNALEPSVSELTDEQLRDRTGEFRQRLEDGETLDDLLPEAFATVREAAQRTLGQRHFDVQVIGAAALHGGNIAEMKTGEGKTLTSTMPVYLNALEGNGVHVVTVNPYLAARDAEWMGRIYRFLGMEVGLVYSQQERADKRAAYGADITYGTNNEFGFDFLRDHMVLRAQDKVQRGHHFAIVDEVDSILVDEARTPLIISGPADQATEWYSVFARRIVGWRVSSSLRSDLALDALEPALYDRPLALTFVARIRDEMKFPSVEALQARNPSLPALGLGPELSLPPGLPLDVPLEATAITTPNTSTRNTILLVRDSSMVHAPRTVRLTRMSLRAPTRS